LSTINGVAIGAILFLLPGQLNSGVARPCEARIQLGLQSKGG